MEKEAARSSALRWAASLALLLPVIVLYLCECARGDGRSFTGFIQYDQPSYMADAQAFFDGGFHLFYGNPFSPDPDTPRIYFQADLFVLGALQKVTGWDPGVVYLLFGFFAGLVCIRIAMELYEEVAGLRSPAQWLGLVLFIWGGGILALMGLIDCLVTGGSAATFFPGLFAFDPAAGWWFLNLGRNLIFPTEAYYHALALGLILVTMRRQYRAALALGFLFVLSHPFTGLQFLLIVTVWAGFEAVVLRNRDVPFLFAGTMGCLLVVHLLYYAVFLSLFPEHRVVVAQWALAWNVSAATALGADILVGAAAIWAMRSWTLTRQLFDRPANRLLATWFLVSFILAHHDLFVTAHQPIHFARGYTWAALFLLGSGPIVRLLETAWTQVGAVSRWAVMALILTVGLSDNLAWFGWQATTAVSGNWAEIWSPGGPFALGASDRDLFRWLMRRPEPHTELLVAADPDSTVPYLGTVYTNYRGWYTHLGSTPYAAARRQEVLGFVGSGAVAKGLLGKCLLVINLKSKPAKPPETWGKPIYENEVYSVYLIRFH